MTTHHFSFPLIFMSVLAITSSCSFPGISESDVSCPDLNVTFAGPSHPFICAGESVPVRVTMANDNANVAFTITSTNGILTPTWQQKGVWQFSSNGTVGTTSFDVYINAECGWHAEHFDVVTVACADTSTGDDTDSVNGSELSQDSELAAPKMPPEIGYEGPRHVILFIGDGMGQQCETGLSRYLTGTDSALAFHAFPYANYMTTWDVSTYNAYSRDIDEAEYDPENVMPQRGYDPAVGGEQMIRGDEISMDYLLYSATDSGAAATALATGEKTDRGNISWRRDDPADGALSTIAEQAQEKGMNIGVVSTVAFSHATPAAFVSHNVDRNNYHDIAREIIFKTSPDVVISAGSPLQSGSYTALSEAEYSWLKSTTTLVFTEWADGVDGGDSLLEAASLAATLHMPLFGLFGTSRIAMPSPVDSPGHPFFEEGPMEEPSLTDATMAAVSVLSQNDEGFFLMVEGGTIDKANHGNDYEWMLGSMWDFERAVQAAVDWVNEDGDDVTMENTLIIVTADHANGYIGYDETNPLGRGELPKAEDEPPRMTYGSGGHTNEMVRVYAQGAGIAGGAQRLFESYQYIHYSNLPIIDNTHIYAATAHFLGVDAEPKIESTF